MPPCAKCGGEIAKGESRARVRNCVQRHFFHVTCAATVESCTRCFDNCRYCKARTLYNCRYCKDRAIDNCRYCKECATDNDRPDRRVSLCDESNHHSYHNGCLRLHGLGETSDCPECATESYEDRNAPPCAACGKHVNGVSWTLDDCNHGLHPQCFRLWIEKRIEGCIACGGARLLCPVCSRPFAECGGHVVVRCPEPECRTRVFEELIGKHNCTLRRLFGDKPCFRCGLSAHEHKQACAKTLAPFMRWDRSRPGRFLYVCPLCSEAVINLDTHAQREHRPVRCRKCGFAVALDAAPAHRRDCGSSKVCPAEGCRATVDAAVTKRAETEPRALREDHDCKGLYACPFECGAFFYSADDMGKHAPKCELAGARPARKRRRAAFERSKEIVLTCAEGEQVDE